MITYRREYVVHTYPASWTHYFTVDSPFMESVTMVEVGTGEPEHMPPPLAAECLRSLADCIEASSARPPQDH